MRLHTDSLTREDLLSAARHARVGLAYTEHGSRKRDHAFEVTLTGESKRRPNSGNYGADNNDYAATWDQWGVFFAWLFDVDPAMVAGSAKRPTYDGRDDYHDKTYGRFGWTGRTGLKDYWPEDSHGDHSWNGRACRKCSAQRF